MLVREWSATATQDGAAAYRAHFDEVVLPALHGLPGFVRATLLTRYDGDFWKIRVLTVWQNLDAVRAFAGADAEGARVELAAQAVLASYDTRAVHWNLVLEDRSKVTD